MKAFERQLTELMVFLLVPLAEMQVDGLKPMERSGLANCARDGVGRREHAFKCFKILEADANTIQWVVFELTKAVVHPPMKGVDEDLKTA